MVGAAPSLIVTSVEVEECPSGGGGGGGGGTTGVLFEFMGDVLPEFLLLLIVPSGLKLVPWSSEPPLELKRTLPIEWRDGLVVCDVGDDEFVEVIEVIVVEGKCPVPAPPVPPPAAASLSPVQLLPLILILPRQGIHKQGTVIWYVSLLYQPASRTAIDSRI
jgi:hypothetical protein